MSVRTVDQGPPTPPPFPIHRFTVAEYEALGRAGILDEDSNVELLDGWIVPKMTKLPPHDSTIAIIQYLLLGILPTGWHLRVQCAISTPDSVPEPDLAVVRGKPANFRKKHPTGAAAGLIVEVADSSLARDRAKADIYARAGIPHYWIVNLNDRQVEVYSQPAGVDRKRTYRGHQILRGATKLELKLDNVAVGSTTVREIFA